MKPNSVMLTVFTPAYNRAHTLHRCYESLKRQTCDDFLWLIIDDGSSDNTKELVEGWMREELPFEIRYEYKENGGMHTAHNRAYQLMDTLLNVCIDSDDYMSDNAVELIVNFWKEHGSDKYSGIIALDTDFDGNVIGKRLERDRKATTLSGYYARGGAGDKKLIYRTDVMNQYPQYPVFPGEKYVSLGYKYLLADQEYELLIMDEPVCLVEYQADGSSNNMFKQYLNNPKGFAFMRKVDMRYDQGIKRKFKTCVHYVSSSQISGNSNFLKESPRKFMTFLAIPAGRMLTRYIRKKVAQGINA
ncbi:MAG: glycosyltransferase family 2 protein [Eubacterium sp.]|nr:glycosyltransferase family 2 protein [Eubacterium sp.]